MLGKLIPTTLITSYPQPFWLGSKDKLLSKLPPCVRLREVWRPSEKGLEKAQDDATLTVLHDQERAGIDLLSEGEIRRESYFNRFANALDAIDIDNPGIVPNRSYNPTLAPRVVGPIRRISPVHVRDVEFARAHTDKAIKITIPGTFTMTTLALNDYYYDKQALIDAYAGAANAELRDMKAASAYVVQIDEPYMQARKKPTYSRRQHRPGAGRHLRSDHRACLFRLRLCREGQTGRLCLPAAARRL